MYLVKVKRIVLGILLTLYFCISCNYYTCDSLPSSYSSYEEAIQVILAAKFEIKESVNTSKSTWIKGASYYSCNRVTGYFILKTDSRKYIHSGMPIEVWLDFKKAESFGSYYNKHIKNRYKFSLNN